MAISWDVVGAKHAYTTRSLDTREAAIYQRADEGFGVNIVCGGK